MEFYHIKTSKIGFKMPSQSICHLGMKFKLQHIVTMRYYRWISPQHDLLLLQKIAELGIGTPKWDEFLEMPDCGFYKNDEGKSHKYDNKFNQQL
jgi:hypothetical protein